MNQLKIPTINQTDGEIQFPQAIHPINQDNWNYNVDVNAQFGMAYDADHIYIRYVVKEHHPKAVCTTINGPVWEDSCVEFFIAFNDGGYYNLEFNCIGNKLVGYGTSNTDRKWLPKEVVNSIETSPSLGYEPVDTSDTPTEWSVNICIPKHVFIHHQVELKQGQAYKINIYKCGDKQKEPHFLSWNAISNASPNFHLPAYFGQVILD